MKLMWTAFLEGPSLARFQTLEKHAKEAGTWPEWRKRALAEFRGRIAKTKQTGRAHGFLPDGDHSFLVEIFLYEGKAEDAWREAQAGGCSGRLWLQLAADREKEHPEDAAPIYWKQGSAAVAAVRDRRYEDAVGLLIKAAAAMKRIGRSAAFVTNLEVLRAKYKIKRNFIDLVEEKRKLLYLG